MRQGGWQGLHQEHRQQGGDRKETATGEACSRHPPGQQSAGEEASACSVPALGCAGFLPFHRMHLVFLTAIPGGGIVPPHLYP